MDRTSSLVGHDRADSMDGLTFESIGLTGWIAWWVALWVMPLLRLRRLIFEKRFLFVFRFLFFVKLIVFSDSAPRCDTHLDRFSINVLSF